MDELVSFDELTQLRRCSTKTQRQKLVPGRFYDFPNLRKGARSFFVKWFLLAYDFAETNLEDDEKPLFLDLSRRLCNNLAQKRTKEETRTDFDRWVLECLFRNHDIVDKFYS